MAKSTVEGPFDVPAEKLKAGRIISPQNARDFWNQHPSLAAKRGCYVFAFRAAKGVNPNQIQPKHVAFFNSPSNTTICYISGQFTEWLTTLHRGRGRGKGSRTLVAPKSAN
jgi:hypothetical protein